MKKLLNLEIAYLPALLPVNWLKITMSVLVMSAVLIVLINIVVNVEGLTGPTIKCERYWS